MHLFRTFGQQSPIKVAVKLVVSKEVKTILSGISRGARGRGQRGAHHQILSLNLTPKFNPNPPDLFLPQTTFVLEMNCRHPFIIYPPLLFYLSGKKIMASILRRR